MKLNEVCLFVSTILHSEYITITLEMVQELGLELKGLNTLCLRGCGGDEVGYLGYTKCTLEVPEISGFKEDVLLLVVKNTEYGEWVPVLLGTLHIDIGLEKVTLEELKSLPTTWQWGTVGCMVLAKQAQLEQNSGVMSIDSNIKLHKNVTIPTMQTRKYWAWSISHTM